MRRLGLGSAVVAVLIGAADARADRGVVAVPSARSAAPAADVVTAVGRAAGADGDAIARARRARAAGAVPVDELAAFAQVAAVAAAGWRAYLAVDIEFAAQRLAAARAGAEALLSLDGGAEVYADVSLRLGLVLAHLGRGAEAAEVLRLAHALDPERAVTAAEFSPDGVEAFEAAIAARPAVKGVEIVAPARADLTIDGKPVGRAPRSLELAVGQHVIVARADGYAPRGLAVSVEPTTERIEVELEARRGADALDDDLALSAGAAEARAGAAVADALLYAELDELYVVASVYRGGQPALLGQRCVLARPACTAVVEIGHEADGLDAAARALVERLRGAQPRYGVLLPADPRVERGERGRPGGSCRLCKRPWLYVGGGALVAALVTTLVIVATSDEPAPVVTVDPGDFTR